MPKRDREDVIKKVYDQLQPLNFSGAEKALDNPQIQDMMTSCITIIRKKVLLAMI